jgi:F420-dependent oxidoreductase-like protein
LRFGLQLSGYTHKAGRTGTAEWIREVAGRAEAAGFDAIYVMDHFRQIPQVGRAWEDFLESWTTLGYLAACTTRVRLGTLVSGITYRNVAHLAKIVATLDVISGGRAVCGLGAAWFEREHKAYGWRFPPLAERYELLEDALRLLPLMWGPGGPAFEGKRLRVPEAICYPRPLQEHVPILVGGQGERRTLRLVAQYADACNLRGDPPVVAHKLAALAAHCRSFGRDPATVVVTHLGTALVGRDRAELDALAGRLQPRATSPESYRQWAGAGTVEEQIGRFRELAELGVAEAIVSLPDLGDTAAVERFADVIEAFP